LNYGQKCVFSDLYIGSKDNPYPAVSTKHTDPATHQKIVQILADAQKQQMAAAMAAAANTVAFSLANQTSIFTFDVF
jgi:hypothetical protein